jgi:hypothetical protein
MRRLGVIALSFAFALAVPATAFAGPDTNSDADTHLDVFDNCRDITNQTQNDFDGDGCGNVCDPDANQNCQTDVFDVLNMLNVQFGFPGAQDLNDNGVVDVFDVLAALNVWFGLPPGPGAHCCNASF